MKRSEVGKRRRRGRIDMTGVGRIRGAVTDLGGDAVVCLPWYGCRY